MTVVKQLLEEKGHQVWSISPDAKVFDAIKMMDDKNVGAVVVIEEGQPVGLFSERHYARNVFLKGKTSPTTRLGDVMETRVVYVKPHQTIEECMAIMSTQRVRHLPVLDDGHLVGIISIGDLVKAVISDKDFVIEQLVHYIHGLPTARRRQPAPL